MEKLRLSEPLRDLRFAWSAYPAAAFHRTFRQAVAVAHAAGVLEGEKCVNEHLVQQRAEALHLQQGPLKAIRQSLAAVIGESEQTLVKIALAAASKLVAGMPVSVEMVEAVVRDALREAEGQMNLELSLHPDEFQLLQRYGSSVLFEQEDRIRFQSSPDVTRGGCIIKTKFGTIDARRETKIALLEKAVTA